MSVKLYDLTLIDKVALGMCYDICRGGIVAAKSEANARKIISKAAWYEGAECWLDSNKSTCNLLSSETERLIITDCNPG